jgi:hypothetical protein
MACYAVDADENVLAYVRWRRRSVYRCRIILAFLALSLSLLAFGRVDVCSAMVA